MGVSVGIDVGVSVGVLVGVLVKVGVDVVDLAALQSADILPGNIKRAKVILSGTIDKAVTLKGLRVTKGARAAIEAAGGKTELIG